MTLPDAITGVLPPDDRMRVGTVLSAFPTTVDIQGTAVPASPVSSYFPIVGDTVSVLRQDATWLILGRTTDPGTGNFPSFQAGYVPVTVAAAGSAVGALVFTIPFRTPPAVTMNINSGVAAVSGWAIRAINITTVGFTWFIFGSVSSFTVDASWIALERTQ